MKNKRTYGWLCIAFAVLFLTGCAKSKEYERLACSLLEEKYGEAFVIEKYLGHEWMQSYFEVLVSPAEDPSILFEAQVDCDGKDVSDEYIEARVCRKAEEQVMENIRTLPGHPVVKIHALIKSIHSNDANMGIREFTEQIQGNAFAVYLHYSPKGVKGKDLYDAVRRSLKGLDMLDGMIQLYITDDSTLQNIQTYFAENAKIYLEYDQYLEDSLHISIPFENGKVQMEEEEFCSLINID